MYSSKTLYFLGLPCLKADLRCISEHKQIPVPIGKNIHIKKKNPILNPISAMSYIDMILLKTLFSFSIAPVFINKYKCIAYFTLSLPDGYYYSIVKGWIFLLGPIQAAVLDQCCNLSPHIQWCTCSLSESEVTIPKLWELGTAWPCAEIV